MLSILIVNWNTREYLRACLDSLWITCKEIPHEIIVVDNASIDCRSEILKAWTRREPRLRTLRLERASLHEKGLATTFQLGRPFSINVSTPFRQFREAALILFAKKPMALRSGSIFPDRRFSK